MSALRCFPVLAVVLLAACDEKKAPTPAAPASAAPIAAPHPTDLEPLIPKGPPERLTAGFTSTCAKTLGGTARCWGRIGEWVDSENPQPIPALKNATQLATYGATVWARMDNGSLTCHGDDKVGAGCGWGAVNRASMLALGLTRVAQVSDAGDFVCVRIDGGGVSCFGKGELGQLGTGTAKSDNKPTERPALAVDAADLVAYGERACVVTNAATVSCWGKRFTKDTPEPGKQPPPPLWDPKPVAIPGLANVVQIALGEEHACVRMKDGSVRCWGQAGEGELGDGTHVGKLAPVVVHGVVGAVEIAVGAHHNCARFANGSVKCWGRNWHGELGDGADKSRMEPVDVKNLSGAQQIVAGGGHSCALVVGGKIACWGANREGQLGNGTHEGNGLATFVSW